MRHKNKKPPKQDLIYSKIKPGEINVRFTIDKDIGRVYFKDIPFPRIPILELDYIFNYLLGSGFLERHTKAIETRIPTYKCLKQWTNHDKPPMRP